MTANYKRLPILDINRFLLQELYAAAVIKQTDYLINNTQYNPIVPVQQTPEMNAIGKPYLTYNIAPVDYDSSEFYNCHEQALYSINGKVWGDVLAIQSVIIDLYRRLDLSARDLNAFVASDSPFRFHYVTLIETNVPDPEPQESPEGYFKAYVMVEYRYARKILQNGRFAS